MWNSTNSFTSFKEWLKNAPDLGNECFPRLDSRVNLYKKWLEEYPQGYVC